ncbi:LysR family transcriptional regulator, partial [bacterium M00.F.Ca.ET.191.01.1.1]
MRHTGFQIHNNQDNYAFGAMLEMLEELRTLVLFAEEGSIQSVARRLPLTQPAVTRQMQRLED